MIRENQIEEKRIQRFLLEHQDSLRLIANGLGIPRYEVAKWINQGNIPPNMARTIYQRYKQTEAYNLKLQGKLESNTKDSKMKG
ncbi:MAG: hypothetical protein DRG63_07345 [Deltaproteobacteria bacterium]|nr:MAG: hypothetical protein DRG63_07345 [Deltaproteobacteria bacterium]